MNCDEGTPERSDIKRPDILSALSFALDLTEGAIPGHAVRTTLLGMRLAIAIELPVSSLGPLFYALQLKDVGCSSNAARVAQLFGGDDQTAKATTKLTDWTGLMAAITGHRKGRVRVMDLAAGLRAVPRNAQRLWSTVLPGATIVSKIKRIAALGKNSERNTQEMTELRCDRGAQILRKLEMGDMACESVRHLDERWDGSGYPDRLAGEAIPLLSRISAIAQNLDVFASTYGIRESVKTLKRRSGTWFDPALVRVIVKLHETGELWRNCEPGSSVDVTRGAAMSLFPAVADALGAEQIDAICEAFSDVVDAKSPFTFRHSVGVTEVTKALAIEMGLDSRRRKLLQRVALLHDLGKLGIPNSILDKPGPLSDGERAVVGEHPGMSRSILARVEGFEEIARIAGEHHERLDGSGYPQGLVAAELSLESRLLSVADCFAALAEERPYRGALPLPEVLSILRKEVPGKLDSTVFAALEIIVTRWGEQLPFVFTHGNRASCSYHPALNFSDEEDAPGSAPKMELPKAANAFYQEMEALILNEAPSLQAT